MTRPLLGIRILHRPQYRSEVVARVTFTSSSHERVESSSMEARHRYLTSDFVTRLGHLMFSKFCAVPPSIAIFSSSVSPGVLMM